MEPLEVAWLAGIFEGEGCLHRRADESGFELVVAMTDEDVVRRCHAITGLGTVVQIERRPVGWKALFRWRVGKRDEVRALVDELLPWMGERRAADMCAFIAWHDSDDKPRRSPASRAARAAYMREWRRRPTLRG